MLCRVAERNPHNPHTHLSFHQRNKIQFVEAAYFYRHILFISLEYLMLPLYGYLVFITCKSHSRPPPWRVEHRHPGHGQQFICSLITDDTGWTAGCHSDIPPSRPLPRRHAAGREIEWTVEIERERERRHTATAYKLSGQPSE